MILLTLVKLVTDDYTGNYELEEQGSAIVITLTRTGHLDTHTKAALGFRFRSLGFEVSIDGNKITISTVVNVAEVCKNYFNGNIRRRDPTV